MKYASIAVRNTMMSTDPMVMTNDQRMASKKFCAWIPVM